MIWYGIVLALQNQRRQTGKRTCFEGVLQGAQLVDDNSKSPDVALVGIGVVRDEFGREVVGSSNESVGVFQGFI